MRKQFILLTLMVNLCCGVGIGQNEMSNYSCLAKIALNKADTVEAIDNYFLSFQYKPKLPYDYLQAAELLCEQKKYKEATSLIKQALELGYPFESLEKRKIFDLQESKSWEKLIRKKQSINTKYQSELNKELAQGLQNMVYIDQQIRKTYLHSFRDSIRKEKCLFSMELVDSINFSNLLKLTKENGFPSYDKVGYLGVDNAWLILWHHRGVEFSTNPLWTEILPYIEIEINNGNLAKDFLTMFIDDNELKLGRPMIYGSLYGSYRNQPEYNELEVFDKKNINIRRAEKGMAPIELWIESMKLPLPKKLE